MGRYGVVNGRPADECVEEKDGEELQGKDNENVFVAQ